MQVSKRQSIVIVIVVAVALIAIVASIFLFGKDKTTLEGTDTNMSEKPTPWEGEPKPSPTVVAPSPDPEKNSDGTTPIYLKSNDYTYLWFRDRCLTQVGKDNIVNVRTGNYGMAVNLDKASIVKLGTMPQISYDDALTEDNSAIDALSEAGVALEITENGNVYKMTEIYNDDYGNSDILFNSRMIRSGTYMQSFDINSIRFGDFDGDARLEFNATPDYFTMSYDFYTKVTHDKVDLKMTFSVPSQFKQVDKIEIDGSVRAIRIADDSGNSYTVLATDGDNGIASISYDDNGTFTLENKGISIRLSTSQRTRRDGIGLLVIPGSTDVNDAKQFIYPLTSNEISAVGIEPYDRSCKVVYNPRRAVYEIELRAAQVSIPNQYTYTLERVAMEIVNNADYKIKPMLVYKHTPNVNGIGTLPILREKDGTPTGIVIQPCKNWHTTEGMPLYNDGSWYEAYVPINVLPNSKSEFEYTSAFDAWGDVPAVSHTQLCLIGYGGPQWQWEQSAIGAFGENFCYSPDLYIVSFLADMRPLMVTGSYGGKFEWTDSVAGADFLVYFDENNKQQFLKQVKTQFYDHGPNLTHIKYAGITMDDKIAAEYSVRMARSDDVVRVYMTFEYEVLEDTKFTRLALFEIGADTNNESNFDTISLGRTSKTYTDEPDSTIPVVKINTPVTQYLQHDLPLYNDSWISLSGGDNRGLSQGASADRGIVIREWQSNFSGEYYDPYMAILAKNAHHGGFPNNQIDITVPPSVREAGMLKKGDKVYCELEYLILPQYAEDYHGPNELLAEQLKITESARWKLVDYEAKGYNIIPTVTVGELTGTFPTVIKADNDAAEFTLKGGVGYVPVEITGLSSHKEYVLEEKVGDSWVSIAEEQEVFGKDYWQCHFDAASGTYNLVYNVWRDSTESESATFRLRKIA